MTSKSLFLARNKENHKRRIWVWVVSILMQLAFYPGYLVMCISRTKFYNGEGAYATEALYKENLQQAMTDALGFHSLCTVLIVLLGIMIGVQGFSYLYDRKKVDLYHSVPVSEKSRFVTVYLNGLFIYLVPYLGSILLSFIIAAAQGAFSSRGLSEWGLSAMMGLLYFLVVYHLVILAVMLTGNIVITGFAILTFLFSGYVLNMLSFSMRHTFFKTATTFFNDDENQYSIVMDYAVKADVLKRESSLSKIASTVWPLCGKWFVAALVFLALAYLCYRKRPAEAAGKAIAFRKIQPFIKIIISVMVGIFVCSAVYNSVYYNVLVTVFCMILGTVLCCAVMEALFEFDITAAVKHLISTGISTVITVVIFCIFYFDMTGYDAYIPNAEKVESAVVFLGDYQHYIDTSEGFFGYPIDNGTWLKENMFLTDIDAVCMLADKGRTVSEIKEMEGSWEEPSGVEVLYRLKSGRKVSRRFYVDFGDSDNEALLDRIMGSQEYRESAYQIAGDEVIIQNGLFQVSYTNGAIESELPLAEAEKLRDAWLKDMEQYDFSLTRHNKPCGELSFCREGDYYNVWELPVYECFTNTIELLKECHAYYPVQLQAEDIEKLEIVNQNYPDPEQDTSFGALPAAQSDWAVSDTAYTSYTAQRMVSEIFDDPDEIAEITEGLYPASLEYCWNTAWDIDRNYEITVTFKPDTGRPYGRERTYKFIGGCVPDFVAERTAYVPE